MTKYYVVYDSTGAVVTRYDGSINTNEIANPPEGLKLLEVADQATMLQTAVAGWTVVNGQLIPPPAPTAAQLLAQAQVTQMGIINAAYQTAITADIPYTSTAGVAQTYQADANSQTLIQQALAIYVTAGAALPTGFAWVAADNSLVPFTLDDIKGLASLIGSRAGLAFIKLQALKAQIRLASDPSSVAKAVW